MLVQIPVTCTYLFFNFTDASIKDGHYLINHIIIRISRTIFIELSIIRIKTLDLLHHGNVIYIFLLVTISSEGKVTIHILQKWRPHAATARLRLKPRQATTTPGRHLYPKRPPKTEKAAKTLGCRDLQNLEVPLGLGGRAKCHECKCTKLNKLFKQVVMMQGEITKQYSIQKSKHEVDL